MKQTVQRIVMLLMVLAATSNAATFFFASDPFAGSDAPTTPGRQIVGNEQFIEFDITNDLFQIDPAFFAVSNPVMFFNGLEADLPAGGVNVVVLQDTPTPFAAGIAANLIADRVTEPGAGFFIYFNSGLDLPRLVYSTDLSDPTADLKVVARMTNLGGQPGRDALPTFTSSNFAFAPVPEPASMLMTAGGLAVALAVARRRARRQVQ